MKEKTAIHPTRSEDFPNWYQEVIKAADLAEHSAVRGCMVIKPYGYEIWERIQKFLDQEFKDRGVKNSYFPLFIPLSFLQKEAEHVAGFAKETAVVTHTKLMQQDGKLIPTDPLEEPLVIRPTSEMIIGDSLSRWIHSYRDLPMKINQWANVVRWEMRPRLFLRTAEFLWQEGHTVHATKEEARAFALEILDLYRECAEELLAIPVIVGRKTEKEKFPGAEVTYTLEAMMGDGKALQFCTSHYMGTNFSKAQNIMYQTKDEKRQYAYTTSWGLSTRSIGGIIGVHGDDNGLRLPPKIAPVQVMIIPFLMNRETDDEVLAYCRKLEKEISLQKYFDAPIRVYLDVSEKRAGDKSWEAVKKGIPIRIEIGSRDIEANQIPIFLRTRDKKMSEKHPKEKLASMLPELLESIHTQLYEGAVCYRKENTVSVMSLADIEKVFEVESFPSRFVIAPYEEQGSFEDLIGQKFAVTVRCIPHKNLQVSSLLSHIKEEGVQQAIFAKSY